MKVTYYNLSVTVETYDEETLSLLRKFLSKYYTSFQKAFGNKESDAKVYVGKLKNFPIFQLHYRQFIHFYQFLKEHNKVPSQVEKIDNRDYTSVNSEFNIREGWKLREDQIPVRDFLLNNPTKSKLIPLQTGFGKDQPLDARIKSPNGWLLMRDIKIGTEIIAKDGTTTRVNGVFPQGKKSVYRVTFSDGRSTECGADHLWKVYYINTSQHKRWRVVNTLEMQRLLSMHNPRVYIDLCESEQNEPKDLLIDPYILGVILGDGCTINCVSITNPDMFIMNKIKEKLNNSSRINLINNKKHIRCMTYSITGSDGYKYKENFLLNNLKRYGLLNKGSHEKFIPEEYLLGSTSQRLELLQGLMDTDGTITKGGSSSYCTTSHKLATQVQCLVRSLGGIASISIRNPFFTNKYGVKQSGRLAYQINIKYRNPSDLFTLPRKKERANDNNQYAKTLKLRVTSVKYSRETETQCISIDHPEHLYITDHFIVTHNTSITLISLVDIGKRIALVLPPFLIEKWVEDICKVHDVDTMEVMVVQGFKSLASLVSMVKDNEFNYKYIIFSARTFQEFVSAYENDPVLCEELYNCTPLELFPLLGVGVMVNDETHMAWHALYRIIIYSNVQYQIGLSATLISDDPVVSRLHKVVYPPEAIYENVAFNKYIDVFPISYTIKDKNLKYIKTTNYGSNNYSHTAFEQSVMRHKFLLEQFINIVDTTAKEYFFEEYKENDKLLIFVTTIKLASILSDYFSKKYSHLNTQRYCEDDSYADMLKADIIVSTLGSIGTGVDIPNLRTSIMTVSLSSTAANIQSLGRLRKLKDRDVKFCYLYSPQISKQKQYHMKRVDIFKDKVANILFRQSRCGLY